MSGWQGELGPLCIQGRSAPEFHHWIRYPGAWLQCVALNNLRVFLFCFLISGFWCWAILSSAKELSSSVLRGLSPDILRRPWSARDWTWTSNMQSRCSTTELYLWPLYIFEWCHQLEFVAVAAIIWEFILKLITWCYSSMWCQILNPEPFTWKSCTLILKPCPCSLN